MATGLAAGLAAAFTGLAGVFAFGAGLAGAFALAAGFAAAFTGLAGAFAFGAGFLVLVFGIY